MDMSGKGPLKFTQMDLQPLAFYEFFAGGGMARLGLAMRLLKRHL